MGNVKPTISPKALSLFKKIILSSKLKYKSESQIVFIFGAKNQNNEITARSSVLTYAKKYLHEFQFFQAEDFFSSFKNDQHDLMSLEGELATYSDCILILLESPGTFAELGAFSHNDELVKKILAVNKLEFVGEDSFINLGPLKKIERKSKFKPVIYANFKRILNYIDIIENNLKGNLRKNAKSINFKTFELFTKNKKYRLQFISDIVTLFGPITKEEVTLVINEIYSQTVHYKADFDISLLESLSFIRSFDGHYFSAPNREFYFYSYGQENMLRMRSNTINHFAKHNLSRLKMLTKNATG
ncbi:retron St85 family effector protein [uncultured Imperialibacter sp.]|uniref:retron St85 family effector protein n=1 Tax=uncultured Imperialibacter sp. TaxID=1672639 RepID=UPI0030D89852|tara:strand:+ start:3013 stop:3915 length:903 start_codon:yes stop_codon:yes gene_type:complete